MLDSWRQTVVPGVLCSPGTERFPYSLGAVCHSAVERPFVSNKGLAGKVWGVGGGGFVLFRFVF